MPPTPLISKQQIATNAGVAARNALRNHIAVGWNCQPGSIAYTMMDLIAIAVEAGIRDAMQNLYTNEEFEHDLTLTP